MNDPHLKDSKGLEHIRALFVLCDSETMYNEQSPMVPLLEGQLFQISCRSVMVPLFICFTLLSAFNLIFCALFYMLMLTSYFWLFYQKSSTRMDKKKSCSYKNSAHFVFDKVGMTHGFVFGIRFDTAACVDTLTIIVLWSFMNSTIYLYAIECVSYNNSMKLNLCQK